jgi:hypothetical protein
VRQLRPYRHLTGKVRAAPHALAQSRLAG